jgi:hypothetical protein
MGGVLADAALQRRARYQLVVQPRVRDLIKSWPDAETVSGFARRLAGDDIGAVLRWRPGPKLVLLRELAGAMTELGIETVADLRARLAGEDAALVRARLRSIRGVGPKTVDYLAILAGCDGSAAIDRHLQRFSAEAGLRKTSYGTLSDTVATAAGRRGWTPTAIDGAIWQHMSTRPQYRQKAATTAVTKA